jgi:hypothetical protein
VEHARTALHGRRFINAYGRECNIRGVNFSGTYVLL